jgi:hypothetical protein
MRRSPRLPNLTRPSRSVPALAIRTIASASITRCSRNKGSRRRDTPMASHGLCAGLRGIMPCARRQRRARRRLRARRSSGVKWGSAISGISALAGRVSGSGLWWRFSNFRFGGAETGSTADRDWFAECLRVSGATPVRSPQLRRALVCNIQRWASWHKFSGARCRWRAPSVDRRPERAT